MLREKSLQRAHASANFIADSPVMKRVARQARRAASVDTAVLITGESGTGKTFLAVEIHRNSRRRDGPFVCCAAAPSSAGDRLFVGLDDESDGTASHRGAFLRAEGGTLLIEEIADLEPTAQARLLSVIETGMVTPLGGGRQQPVDVRVIATSSKNLDLETKAGRFRSDLMYRISVLPIHLPPLKSRREDVPALVREFLRRTHHLPSDGAVEVEPRWIKVLQSLDWPRNVQQLRQVVESMLAPPRSDSLTAEELRSGANNAPLALVEKDTILAALDAHEGNRTRAAESLGISVRTLQRRLRQWRLDD